MSNSDNHIRDDSAQRTESTPTQSHTNVTGSAPAESQPDPEMQLSSDYLSGSVSGLLTVAEEKEKAESESELVYDKGYCWVICFACFILNTCTWGMNAGFAIYFSVYINENTFPGATKLDYAAIGGLALGATIVFTPLVNCLQGLMGVRPMIILGNCIQFLSLMLASYCKHLWQLYLTQGLLQSVGLALISFPGVTLLPQFFKKRRVLASGLATAGSGVGGVIFNIGMQRVVEVRDVFWGLRAQAIISFGLVWLAILLIRSRSKLHKIEFLVLDYDVMKMWAFWCMILYVICCMFGYVVTLYMMAHYTTSLGYSEYQGSIAAAMISLGSAIGRPLVGFLADRYGAATLIFETYLLSAIFCFAMWIPARNYATVIALSIILGAIMGTVWGTAAPLMARLVGLRKMNNAFSMTWSILGAAGIASPVIGTTLVRGSGDSVDPTQYLDCIIFAGVAFFVCAMAVFFTRGFILARDEILAKEGGESGAQELNSDVLVHTRVPFGQALKCCFKFVNVKA